VAIETFQDETRRGQTASESEDEAHLIGGLVFVGGVALISGVWIVIK
jgi:hypothetical protein